MTNQVLPEGTSKTIQTTLKLDEQSNNSTEKTDNFLL